MSARAKTGRTAWNYVSAKVVRGSCVNSDKLINVIRRENELQNWREKFKSVLGPWWGWEKRNLFVMMFIRHGR
jgi:hypothetical protein